MFSIQQLAVSTRRDYGIYNVMQFPTQFKRKANAFKRANVRLLREAKNLNNTTERLSAVILS